MYVLVLSTYVIICLSDLGLRTNTIYKIMYIVFDKLLQSFYWTRFVYVHVNSELF